MNSLLQYTIKMVQSTIHEIVGWLNYIRTPWANLHMMELPPARSLQSCIKIHGLDHWVKNPRKEDGSSWAHHEGVEGEGCPWAAAGASLLPLLHHLQSFHQCLPSLASRVLACSRVSGERECVANERMSERVALAEKYLFPFRLTLWSVGWSNGIGG